MAALAVAGGMPTTMRWMNERAYDTIIADVRRTFGGVPANVIKAVIAAESGFAPGAVRVESHLGDASRGLMQVLYTTAKGLGYTGQADGLLDPYTSVFYGTKLLNDLYGRLGSWPDAFSAYNGGERPALGFGRKATAPLRVCLRRDANGDCAAWRNVPAGEYANQPYVDRVSAYLRYFAGEGDPGWPAVVATVLVGLVAWRVLT